MTPGSSGALPHVLQAFIELEVSIIKIAVNAVGQNDDKNEPEEPILWRLSF